MPSGPAELVSFTVTSATDTIKVGYDGKPVHGDTIGYTATNGYNGSVFLPRPDSRDKATVIAAVTADLKSVLAAQAMSGTVRR